MAAEKQGMETVAEVDSEQIYKAVKALMEYVKKTKNDTKLFLNEDEIIMLCVTVWEIPSQEQKIKIALPHEIRSETVEICLFTKDEPNMNADETQKFYQKLLNEHNIKNITHIIPYKSLKTEYKPYEAKRRLLSTFDVFLADDRIRRLLPSHLGKHFYRSKKIPLSVNLASNDLAKDLCKMIQGTVLPVNNRGSCYSSRVAHTGMKLGEIVENVIAAIHTIGVKLPQQWKNVKILHLKTLNSPALPIYTSDMCNLEELQKKKSKKHKETIYEENATCSPELDRAERLRSALLPLQCEDLPVERVRTLPGVQSRVRPRAGHQLDLRLSQTRNRPRHWGYRLAGGCHPHRPLLHSRG
ncbi:ribosomal L1 domain-containing protein 1 isoform X5 [Narcine bancroftii]|uniref:ribosomal L1 domain-containing protein 1 isoform X5 n=1 Tax=Narcine bancroftii TaxID=1343680 RepID=UPI0038320DB8